MNAIAIWILIVFPSLHGAESLPKFQEFNSKETCEAAMRFIRTPQYVESGEQIYFARCFKK